MFLRSKLVGGRLYWQVVETYREKPRGSWETKDRIRHRTVYSLGPHETRESAQAAWDEAVARGDDRVSLQDRRTTRTYTQAEIDESHRLMGVLSAALEAVVSERSAPRAGV